MVTKLHLVTPLAGVWIEIPDIYLLYREILSLPLRECGLKCVCYFPTATPQSVTPLAGVWIKI